MHVKRLSLLALCVALVLSSVLPISAFAREREHKVVRVGWYESAFHRTDSFGRRSGYGYEYQQRIAVYTGWTYEYVEGSWSELLEMLISGEIDLLSDVSYTEQRAEKILYSSEAMGAEGYHVFIAPDNTEIRPDLYSSLNGKRVAVNKNSIQEQFFTAWTQDHDVTPEIIETTEKSPVLFEKLASGEYDALVTLDTYGNTANVIPVWKVGFAESYFGINKNRADLKQELDAAMNRLLEDNREFNQELTEKYNKPSAVNSFLTAEEKEWLNAHGTIRVGYRDDYLPFCDRDENGELIGTLADFLQYAETSERNARLSFQTQVYSSTEEAIQALKRGELDCVFPLSLSTYDAERQGVIITYPLVRTDMYAIVRNADYQGVSPDRAVSVAVPKGNLEYDSFLMDNFPAWKPIYCEGLTAALLKVSDAEADCGLVNNYRLSWVSEPCAKYKLSVLATGAAMEISFAVGRQDDCLYSILNKIIRLIPDTSVNSSLTNHSIREDKIGFIEFVKGNLAHFIAVASVIAVIILLLVLRNVRTEEKMKEGRQIISETERDHLTELYNWNYFLVYANRLYHDNPDKPMDAVVLNIDRFHSVNALHGWDFGDRVLKAMGSELKRFLAGTDGIASRFEADRFDLYCPHRDDWQDCLERFQAKLDSVTGNAKVHLRMGVKPWQRGMEPVRQFDCARTACNKVRGDFTAQAVIYDAAMGQREELDQRLLNDLTRALEEHELEVYYQPKYTIQPDKPRLSSAEALVRWRHPELGLIMPDVFIPLFESSGQVNALDKYVWEEAARQIAAWREQYGVTLPVSVNISRVDVFEPDLAQTLESFVKRYGLRHQDLKLEITESAFTEDSDRMINVIKVLRDMGFEIEMDDFGSGFSSLNMLSSMPIDVLKMDMIFIRNMERHEKDYRLVELIMDIAKYLRVIVVAEGVETEKQLHLLKSIGCDMVQGYYFSRPLPAAEFERKFLAKGAKA